MSFAEFYQATAGIGDAYAKGLESYKKRSALAKLGEQVQGGDYAGAASTAFNAGDVAAGTSLLKLGEERRLSKLEESNAAMVLGGAPGSLSALGTPASADLSRSLPIFAQGSDIGRYASAIQSNESGGKYGIVGPTHPKYGRALGAYQVMESNLPSWSREAVGREVSADEFLRSPQIQDAVFQKKFGQSVAKYGNPEDAASVWFTGRPLAQGANAKDVLGTTGAEYVRRFNAALDRRPASAAPALPQTAMRMPDEAGGQGPAQMASVPAPGLPAPRRAPVQVANSEAEVQALEARMGMVPAAPRQVANLDPRADMPAEGAIPMGYSIPEGRSEGRQMVGGQDRSPGGGYDPSSPSGILNSQARQVAGPRMGVPAMGAPPAGRAMTLPPEAGGPPVQVAQAGGGVPAGAVGQPAAAAPGGDMGLSARLSRMPPQERVDYLTRLSGLRLPEQLRGVVKSQLDAALQDARDPEGVREFVWARRNGMTQAANPAAYAREKAGDQTQFIQSGGRVLLGNRSAGTVQDVTPEGLPPTWRPLTPQERQGLGVRSDAAVYMTPEGPKSLSGQTINVSPGERAQDAAIGADYGKRFVEMQRGGVSARSTLSTIDTMQRAMNAPGFYSGTGGQSRLAFNRALASFGITDKDKAAPAEVFDALANKLVMDSLGGSLGAGVSNSDVSFLQRTAPDLAKTPEGNRQLLDVARKVANRQQQVAQLARDYAQANGGRLDPGFDDALTQWADANPLFSQGQAGGDAQQQRPALPAPHPQQVVPQRQPAASAGAAPSAGAVDYLRANPGLRGAFDEKYGAGAADRALGGR